MRALLILPALIALAACAAAERISYVGRPPPLSPMDGPGVEDGEPQDAAFLEAAARREQIAALMAARNAPLHPSSLWGAQARTFFGDPRAARVGDILTVNIDIADRAQVSNQTNRSRTATEDADLTNIFGGEAALSAFFNDAINPASVASFGSQTALQGAGSVNRSETIELTAAAIVVDVLWNGNLIIHGRQEVRINNEVRELLISGIVRPQDIAADNTISHTQIAEARISYGGRGHISDMQRPPIAHELYGLLWPF